MKRFLLLTVLIGAALPLGAANVGIQPREGGGGGGGDTTPAHGNSGGGTHAGRAGGNHGGHARMASPSVVIKMQRHSIPRPDVIRHSNHIVRDQRTAIVPERDERGVTITQRSAVAAPQNHTTIVRNPAIIRDIRHQQHVEIVPNRYYWHTVGGVRYSHYYDHGIHWYGFYHGPNFYWTRYYGDRWWWFDAGFNRWVYWWDGYWWWPAPAGGLYVYVDNNYYPYDEGVVTAQKPEIQSAPETSPATPSEGNTYVSPDKQRMVQIYGAQSEAFLYDNTSGKPVFLKYLGDGVEKVRFSGGKNGKPAQILMDFKDGNFALFTADGNPMDAAALSASDTDTSDLPLTPPPGATAPSNTAPPSPPGDTTP